MPWVQGASLLLADNPPPRPCCPVHCISVQHWRINTETRSARALYSEDSSRHSKQSAVKLSPLSSQIQRWKGKRSPLTWSWRSEEVVTGWRWLRDCWWHHCSPLQPVSTGARIGGGRLRPEGQHGAGKQRRPGWPEEGWTFHTYAALRPPV